MTATLLIVLTVLAFGFILDTAADLLDLSQLKRRRLLPGTEALYPAGGLERALRYHRDWKRFHLVRRFVGGPAFLAFLFFGGFGIVDSIARTVTMPWNALVFVALLLTLRGLLDLPFNLYGTFVIEGHYGFNRTTPGTFIADLLKGIVLAAFLGAPIFLAILWFFERTGPSGWLPAWLTASAFQLLLAYLAPALLLPLFNKYEPLPAGETHAAIEAFCKKIDFHISGVFQMDGSKRSTKANAFFTGFGKLRRLVLFDTLLQKLSHEELMAVLAHEIGHFKERHIHKFLLLSLAASGLSFYIFSFFIGNAALTEAFGIEQVSVYATLVAVGLLYGPISRILGIGINAISRRFEFAADRYSARCYGNPQALASGLMKISTDALANPAPHPLRVVLDYSHPPVPERMARLKR